MEDDGRLSGVQAPIQIIEVNGNLLPKVAGKFVANWEDWMLEHLKSQWGQQGVTASDIGKVIGKTRNAVIGKARRLGLAIIGSTGGSRWRKGELRAKEKPLKTISISSIPEDSEMVVRAKKPTAPKFYAAAVALENSAPVSIMELGPRSCRAIVGKGRDGLAAYCNNQCFWDEARQRYKSFCPAHSKIYYNHDPYRRKV